MRTSLVKQYSLEGIREQIQQVEMEFRWWLDSEQKDDAVLPLLQEEIYEVEEEFHCQDMIELEVEAHQISGHLEQVMTHKEQMSTDEYSDLFFEIKNLETHFSETLKRA
jgi:hypothetical protein